jgi:hypothetical protein
LEQRIIEEAAPPGYTPKYGREESVATRLADFKKEFGHQYDAIYKNATQRMPLPKGNIQYDVLKRAMNPEGHALSASEAKTASDFVADQLSKLDTANNTETLAKIRTALSEKASNAFKAGNRELGGHYSDIEDALRGHVEEALKADLDPQAFNKLQGLNTQYAKFKTILAAAGRRGDAGGRVTITPDKLGGQLLKQMGPDRFVLGAEGGGPFGNLRVLARAGKVVTSPPRPTTGALMGLLERFPGASYVTGAQGYLSARHPAMLMGETAPQRILQRTLAQPTVSGALGQEARVGALEVVKRLAAQAKAEEEAKKGP